MRWKFVNKIEQQQIIDDLTHEFYRKKGGEKMAQIDDIDIQRLSNLIKGFGWEITQTKIETHKLNIQIEKDREEPEVGKENIIPE